MLLKMYLTFICNSSSICFFFFLIFVPIFLVVILLFCSLFDSMKGIDSIIGAVAQDMGILTTPQLHWMVHARNKGLESSELNYFNGLSNSFKLFYFIYLS